MFTKRCDKHSNTKIENISITLATTITTKKVMVTLITKVTVLNDKHYNKNKSNNYNNRTTTTIMAATQSLK